MHVSHFGQFCTSDVPNVCFVHGAFTQYTSCMYIAVDLKALGILVELALHRTVRSCAKSWK